MDRKKRWLRFIKKVPRPFLHLLQRVESLYRPIEWEKDENFVMYFPTHTCFKTFGQPFPSFHQVRIHKTKINTLWPRSFEKGISLSLVQNPKLPVNQRQSWWVYTGTSHFIVFCYVIFTPPTQRCFEIEHLSTVQSKTGSRHKKSGDYIRLRFWLIHLDRFLLIKGNQ